MNCQPFINKVYGTGTGTGTGHNQCGSHLQSQMSLDSEDGALDSEDQNQSPTTVLLRIPIKKIIISNQGFFFTYNFITYSNQGNLVVEVRSCSKFLN